MFAGSVRDNILFGQPMERERYKRTIKACALERVSLKGLGIHIVKTYLQCDHKIQSGIDPLLPHFPLQYFLNEEIDSCERLPYFNLSIILYVAQTKF